MALDVEHSLANITSAERLALTESDSSSHVRDSAVTRLFCTVIIFRLLLQLLPYNVIIIQQY